MRVLVTGATGFLGGALVRHLGARGFEPIGLGRNEARCRALQEAGLTTIRADLSRPALYLVDSIGGVDAVVHCAALSAPWGRLAAFRAANVEGTRNALDLAEALGARRFVNISSPTVYFEMKDKIAVAESLGRELSGQRGQVPDLHRAFDAVTVEPEQRPALRQLERDLDSQLERAATRAFRDSFLIGAGLALLALLTVLVPRRRTDP